MIAVEVQSEDDWGAGDWTGLATNAVLTAISHSRYRDWIDRPAAVEVSVKFGDDTQVVALNASYRGKNGPTNVLSFPMVDRALLETLGDRDEGETLLGDIILAHGLCGREAEERGTSVESHASHLIVHGTLHLLGYDHIGEADAEAMETIERIALAAIGITDPDAPNCGQDRE